MIIIKKKKNSIYYNNNILFYLIFMLCGLFLKVFRLIENFIITFIFLKELSDVG